MAAKKNGRPYLRFDKSVGVNGQWFFDQASGFGEEKTTAARAKNLIDTHGTGKIFLNMPEQTPTAES